ncbi:hypothetical protein ACLBOM_05970 [Escherichia coli]
MAANFRLNALLCAGCLAELVTYALAVSRPHFLAAALSHQHSITSGGGNDSLEASHISDLFLRQFDHFDLRAAKSAFLTPSGQRAELAIPQLTWLNDPRRHRAEGLVSLSSLTGQHGVMAGAHGFAR